jgi:predicted Zn-dependent peptidase
VETIVKFTLKNGLTVLCEHLPYIRSVLLGLWVKEGSRVETPSQFGMAHFLEHMLFKGTKKRSAHEIAESLESVGGELNAFTSREHCCYYARATHEHAELVFDVISDLVFHPNLNREEMEKEKLVVCQEIDMYEDSPEELAHEILVREMYGEPLGHPVIGYKDQVDSFQYAKLRAFHEKLYHPSNLFLTVVGNLKESEFRKLSSTYFEEKKIQMKPLSASGASEEKKQGVLAVQKNVEQCHLVLGWHAFEITHIDRYVLHLISAYLGGGMSSVLFQDIRETLGLTYNIYSFVRAYKDSGFLGIYSAQSEENSDQVLVLVLSIVHKLVKEGISAERLDQLKSQLKGNLLLGLERTSFRMNRMGVGHLYFGQVICPEELIAMVNKVTKKDILRVSSAIFSQSPSCVSVGPLSQERLEASLKKSEAA